MIENSSCCPVLWSNKLHDCKQEATVDYTVLNNVWMKGFTDDEGGEVGERAEDGEEEAEDGKRCVVRSERRSKTNRKMSGTSD